MGRPDQPTLCFSPRVRTVNRTASSAPLLLSMASTATRNNSQEFYQTREDRKWRRQFRHCSLPSPLFLDSPVIIHAADVTLFFIPPTRLFGLCTHRQSRRTILPAFVKLR